MTTRKTLATIRSGASKIRSEMELVYTGDVDQEAVLARLMAAGYAEKAAKVTYKWHYENTSAVDGSLLAAPTFETGTREKKPATADAPVEAKEEETPADANQILADLSAELESLGEVGDVAADEAVAAVVDEDHRVGA